MAEEYDEAAPLRLTPAAYQRLLTWVRFQSQLCEIEHPEDTECDDETHTVAFLFAFILIPTMEALGVSLTEPVNIEEQGFIEEIDGDS